MSYQPKKVYGRENPLWKPNFRPPGTQPVSGNLQSAKSDFDFSFSDINFDLIDDDYLEEQAFDYDGDGDIDEDDVDSFKEMMDAKKDFPTKELSKQYCKDSSAWMLENSGVPNVVMSTIHGSFLYGSATQDSSADFYLVSSTPMDMRLSMDGRNVRMIGLDKYHELLLDHDIQAIEAFYSPYKVFDSEKHRKKILSFEPDMDEVGDVLRKRAGELKFSNSLTSQEDAKRLDYCAKLVDAHDYTPVWKNFDL